MGARPIVVGLLVLVALAIWLNTGREQPVAAARPSVAQPRYLLDAEQAERRGLRTLGQDLRRKSLGFAPEVHPVDRMAVLAAVAAARPEAQRLIALVDGLVTIRVGTLGGQAVGRAGQRGTGYEVTLDLARVSSRFGQRGINNVVLHELAHVVDFALVSDELLGVVDARTPKGLGCEDGRGGCAVRPERFADSFGKWATGDIGVDLYLGYQVPPPSGDWGEPLEALLG